MGLLTPLLTRTPADTGRGVAAALADATWPDNLPGMVSGEYVSRAAAMQVPAVARARNVIAGTVAELPLEAWQLDGSRSTAGRPWLRQPERNLARAHTLAWTADDLLFHGVAYWQVVAVYAEDGRPSRFERIAPDRVGQRTTRDGRYVERFTVDGAPVPNVGVGRLVVIHALEEGVLARGGRTIKAAVELEKAALRYAQSPTPSAVLRNKGPALDKTKVDGLLAAWKQARQTNATAYLSADLELEAVGFDPAALQLVEARQHLVTEVARLCNLDAYYLNGEVGSSLTYSNALDERRKLIDFTLRHYLAAIEQRLSMDDVTATGLEVRLGLDDFLRADPKDRAELWKLLLDAGVIDLEDAKRQEPLARKAR